MRSSHQHQRSRVEKQGFEAQWADSEAPSWTPLSSVLLLIASGFYFLATWLLAGLYPLPWLVTRFQSRARRVNRQGFVWSGNEE